MTTTIASVTLGASLSDKFEGGLLPGPPSLARERSS